MDYLEFNEAGDELHRKTDPAVRYMELKEEAGGFSCGNCSWLEGTYCQNQKVRATVSPNHGCCNLFTPSDKVHLVFPE